MFILVYYTDKNLHKSFDGTIPIIQLDQNNQSQYVYFR